MRKLHIIAFTKKGLELAENIAGAFGGVAVRSGQSVSAKDWVKEHFKTGNQLVFVGALGIAVRLIAPFLEHKTKDPAVVVIEESGNFVIPVLSGHIGGANELAKELADYLGATAVLTTATDVRECFAVDNWAKKMGLAIRNPQAIKAVSSKVLAGESVRLAVEDEGDVDCKRLPKEVILSDYEEADFIISVKERPWNRELLREKTLQLVPKHFVLGIGCKKGTSKEQIEELYDSCRQKLGICEESITGVYSVDLKKEEAGLVDFCKEHDFLFSTYSVEELQAVAGDFSGSDFVQATVGVDNVCERSAVLGGGGELVLKKQALNGVTLAVAERKDKKEENT